MFRDWYNLRTILVSLEGLYSGVEVYKVTLAKVFTAEYTLVSPIEDHCALRDRRSAANDHT